MTENQPEICHNCSILPFTSFVSKYRAPNPKSGLGMAALHHQLPCSSTCLISQTDVDVLTSGFWPGLTVLGNISQQVTELLLEVLAVYPKKSLTFVV